ncbi:MAG: Asp-tRNA(Asn)/Glu-tRNA(Gln) amidotransferase subunit GatB [Patescibacteria group bacterium]|nr:Asp-tRNA(Asn)/Glu-tRNA(Gln) amidotransferase subunit GatB [Patescibacteria group bacterium]
MEYNPTIGLEIHIELKTKTKMFCDCSNDPEEKNPNQNTCPVCLGHPGALPTINKKAVEAVIKVGLALDGNIAEKTKFDRKNYFYPDLPKGYQISQYDKPLVSRARLKGINITRIHLEEDTGSLLHHWSTEGPAGPNQKQAISTLVDFNRSSAPLMELVTEPEFRSAKQVSDFAKELQRIVRYLGVSDADMEKGEMRVEANVSLNMGTKVELKNINSFKAVEKAIEYETKRQEELLREGKKVKQETRGWDDPNKRTFSQRSKEEAHDYRYFPEPDLPMFETEIFDLENLKKSLGELPAARAHRFSKEYNLTDENIELLIEDKSIADYFEAAGSELLAEDKKEGMSGYKLLCSYLTNDLRGLINESKEYKDNYSWMEKVPPEHLAHLVSMITTNKLTTILAKDIIKKMLESGLDPEDIAKNDNLSVSSDKELKEAIIKIVSEETKAIEDYKAGKGNAMQFLIGKTMQKLKGRGDPKQIRVLLEEVLTNIKK